MRHLKVGCFSYMDGVVIAANWNFEGGDCPHRFDTLVMVTRIDFIVEFASGLHLGFI